MNGDDIRREPIEDRKRRLAGLLRMPHDGIALNEAFADDGTMIYKHACGLGCEGIVSKRLGSPCRAGRSAHWPKIKNPAAFAVRRLEKRTGMVDRVKTVLFLCTGNYYRSRFAEELFNHRAERAGLDWRAHSRGLALERGSHNVGPISPFALQALKKLEITARGADRFPQQCTAGDFTAANFVIAVKEAEHRPLMRERFAEWKHLPDYWNIDDVEDAAPAIATKLLAQQVQKLLLRFCRTPL